MCISAPLPSCPPPPRAGSWLTLSPLSHTVLRPAVTVMSTKRAPGGGRTANNRSSTGMNFYTDDSPGLKISPVRPPIHQLPNAA